MKRITILLLAAVFTVVFAGQASAQSTETDIFGIEIGQFVGYDFGAEDIGADQLMGIHFGMTDNMELGFVFLQNSNLNFVRMTYFLNDAFGFQLSTGGNTATTNPAGGVGVFTSPIRRDFDDTITTSLRLALDYLVPDFTQDVADGIVGVTISGKIAF